jgi:hypothetical protein
MQRLNARMLFVISNSSAMRSQSDDRPNFGAGRIVAGEGFGR